MIQYLIITALVLWSCVIVFNKLMPRTAAKSYHALADGLQKLGWQSLANKLRPQAKSVGCGGGCGCAQDSDTPKQHPAEVKSVKWK